MHVQHPVEESGPIRTSEFVNLEEAHHTRATIVNPSTESLSEKRRVKILELHDIEKKMYSLNEMPGLTVTRY